MHAHTIREIPPFIEARNVYSCKMLRVIQAIIRTRITSLMSIVLAIGSQSNRFNRTWLNRESLRAKWKTSTENVIFLHLFIYVCICSARFVACSSAARTALCPLLRVSARSASISTQFTLRSGPNARRWATKKAPPELNVVNLKPCRCIWTRTAVQHCNSACVHDQTQWSRLFWLLCSFRSRLADTGSAAANRSCTIFSFYFYISELFLCYCYLSPLLVHTSTTAKDNQAT